MFWRLVLLFTLVPLVELYLLLTLGSLVGFWPTVAIVVVTALLGSYLSKREGLRVWREYQKALAEMRMPEEGIVSGLLVLVGAVLLVTPGVLTDVVGLGLMIPPLRLAIARYLEKRLRASFEVGTSEAFFVRTVVGPDGSVRRQVRVESSRSERPPPRHAEGDVIEGEVLEGDVIDARGRVLKRAE